jgi:protocatechuate 3,4-dioxygenase beta subunit
MNEIQNVSRRRLLRQGLAAAATVAIGSRIANATTFDAPSLGAFALAPKDVCTLTCAQTLGPCYYDARLIREDITEGKAGMPTRISFLVVDADTCKPVSNAAIDIWHTDAVGIYSAPINAMCNPGDTLARQQTFTRGVQMTSADGWAHFNTIYPGWYSGRTTHIHATVRVNATDVMTTQFYFDDALSDTIYRTHPTYAARPARDTRNTSDNILGGNLTRMAPYIFSTKLYGASDCLASDTSYYDAYQFSGTAGDTVTIELSSSSFDAYAVLLDPNNKPVADNDDVTESNTNSRLTFTLTSSGTWTVIANTLKAGASGDYAIALTSSACAVTAPAGPRRRTASHE